MKKITFTVIVACNTIINAQNIGISSTGSVPNGGAGLDVNFSDKGLLISRVSLSDVSVYNPPITGGGSSKPTSMLVYNTNTAVVGGNGEVFYYWDSVVTKTKYIETISDSHGSSNQVLVKQNAGTTSIWSNAMSSSGDNSGANIIQFSKSKGAMDWITCYTTCRNATDGGYTDWRMPTLDEIFWARVSGVISPPDGWKPNDYLTWTATCTPSSGYWIVFREADGSWASINFTPTLVCRCVR